MIPIVNRLKRYGYIPPSKLKNKKCVCGYIFENHIPSDECTVEKCRCKLFTKEKDEKIKKLIRDHLNRP
jgi:hypothetical protein